MRDHNDYDLKWLKITLLLLVDNLKDLRTWSVHNDDEFNEEIGDFMEAFIKLKSEIQAKKPEVT